LRGGVSAGPALAGVRAGSALAGVPATVSVRDGRPAPIIART
jgi:hypothetical protein